MLRCAGEPDAGFLWQEVGEEFAADSVGTSPVTSCRSTDGPPAGHGGLYVWLSLRLVLAEATSRGLPSRTRRGLVESGCRLPLGFLCPGLFWGPVIERGDSSDSSGRQGSSERLTPGEDMAFSGRTHGLAGGAGAPRAVGRVQVGGAGCSSRRRGPHGVPGLSLQGALPEAISFLWESFIFLSLILP